MGRWASDTSWPTASLRAVGLLATALTLLRTSAAPLGTAITVLTLTPSICKRRPADEPSRRRRPPPGAWSAPAPVIVSVIELVGTPTVAARPSENAAAGKVATVPGITKFISTFFVAWAPGG